MKKKKLDKNFESRMPSPKDQLRSGMSDLDNFNNGVRKKKKKKHKHKGKDASLISSQEALESTTFAEELLEVTHISKKGERHEHEDGSSADRALKVRNWIASHDLSGDCDVSAKKKKRKRNKHKEHAPLVSDDAVSPQVASELVDPIQTSPKKKKRKRGITPEEGIPFSEPTVSPADTPGTEQPWKAPQTSVRKNRVKRHEEGGGSGDGHSIGAGVGSQDLFDSQEERHRTGQSALADQVSECPVRESHKSSKKHKKKKKKEKRSENDEAFGYETIVDSSLDGRDFSKKHKKKKKKEKRSENDEAFGYETIVDSSLDGHDFSKKHKKKKKKEKRSENDEAFCSETNLDSTLDESHFSKKHKKKKKKEKRSENDEAFCSETILDSTLDESHFSKKHKKKKKKKEYENEEAAISEPILDSPLDALFKSPKKHKKKKKKKEKQNDENSEASISEAISDSPLNKSCESVDRRKKKKRKLYDEHEGYNSSELIFDSPSDVSSKKRKKNTRDQENEGGRDFSVPSDWDTDFVDGRDSNVDKTASHEDTQYAEVKQENDSSHSSETGSSEFSIHTWNSENSRPTDNSDSDSGNVDNSEESRGETPLQPGDTTTANATKHEEKNHEEELTVESRETSITSEDASTGIERSPTPETPIQRRADLDDGEASETCYICKENVGSKQDYIQHLAERHGKLSYQCPRCSRPLSSDKMVKHHLETSCVHKTSGAAKVTPFDCFLCPMSYAFKCNLTRHFRTEHEKKKPLDVKCSNCNKTFTTTRRAADHEPKCKEGRAPRPEGDKTFECSYCNKMFASSSSCSHHIRAIHKKHVFECVCGKQFRGSTYYYRHRKVCIKLKEMNTLPGKIHRSQGERKKRKRVS